MGFKLVFIVIVGLIIFLVALLISALLGKPLYSMFNKTVKFYTEDEEVDRVNEEKEIKNNGKN